MSTDIQGDLDVQTIGLRGLDPGGAALRGEVAELTAVFVSTDSFYEHAIPWLVQAEAVEVVARARELERGLELVADADPDMLLIEASRGIDPTRLYKRLRQARKSRPSLRTIVLCASGDSRMRDCAFAGGATRVVGVERASSILDAIRSLRQGARETAERPLLTRRELEILRLVAEGRTNREVAELLWVAHQTVKYHLANVYRKLQVNTRADAIEWATHNDVAGFDAAGAASPVRHLRRAAIDG